MPCFLCKSKTPPYQALIGSRIRFIRKAYPEFKDNSFLCLRCFSKFERLFKSKSKDNRSVTDISAQSNSSIRTVSTTISKSISNDNITIRDKRLGSSKENTQSNGSSILHFTLQSDSSVGKTNTSPPLQYNMESRSSNDTMDSTDRIVHNTKENPSLRDSVRVSRNAETSVARVGAIAAEKSALRRKRAREDGTSFERTQTPTGRQLARRHITADDNSEMETSIPSDDLANVGPIVKRRKEPVVHLNQDIMDIYLANTSGG